ncbi:MAG: hypothetical protein DRR16_05705, partial [Candidatus Parabeggiatoa sp. nov. 3]
TNLIVRDFGDTIKKGQVVRPGSPPTRFDVPKSVIIRKIEILSKSGAFPKKRVIIGLRKINFALQ